MSPSLLYFITSILGNCGSGKVLLELTQLVSEKSEGRWQAVGFLVFASKRFFPSTVPGTVWGRAKSSLTGTRTAVFRGQPWARDKGQRRGTVSHNCLLFGQSGRTLTLFSIGILFLQGLLNSRDCFKITSEQAYDSAIEEEIIVKEIFVCVDRCFLGGSKP